MKLIDYDALEENAMEYQERHKGDELTRGEFKLIDNFMFECPKVDAIPVEWLREFDLYYSGISGGSPYMNTLLEAWWKGKAENDETDRP